MPSCRTRCAARAIRRFVPLILLFAPAPAFADGVARWRPMIEEASTRFGVPTSWIERVMRAESRGLTVLNGRPIRSSAGAIGLMQLMPETWQAMRDRLALGTDPDDPHDNILAGTCFLRLMYDRFGYPGMFGAYNAGPTVYAAWLAGARRLPSETLDYVRSLSGATQRAVATTRPSPSPSLFFVRRPLVDDQPETVGIEQQTSLFAVRKVVP